MFWDVSTFPYHLMLLRSGSAGPHISSYELWMHCKYMQNDLQITLTGIAICAKEN